MTPPNPNCAFNRLLRLMAMRKRTAFPEVNYSGIRGSAEPSISQTISEETCQFFYHLVTQCGIYVVSYWLFIQRPAARVLNLLSQPSGTGGLQKRGRHDHGQAFV